MVSYTLVNQHGLDVMAFLDLDLMFNVFLQQTHRVHSMQ